MNLTCECCGINNDTVSTAYLGPYKATVGNLCTHCKHDINKLLIPAYNRFWLNLYTQAQKWMIKNKHTEYKLAE